MDVGDRVKLVRGNPFGKIGTIKFVLDMKGPVNVTYDAEALNNAPVVKHFEIEADDGTTFSAAEDQLELV